MTDEERALITADPEVSHGQARVAGTRIPVSLVLGCLADCMTAAKRLEEFPSLSIKGIRAAAAYAAELASEQPLPLSGS